MVFGIRWRRFLANMFLFLFKILYDRERLFWLTTITVFSQRFCLSVRICTVVPGSISDSLRLKFWVKICFSMVVLWVDGISEDKVVLNLWLNNFSAGEVPFWSGCEYRGSIAIKWSSELNFALLRVCLTDWMGLSA